MSTKEQIWKSALELFAVKGYDAVSVRDIAREVGIRESSIYKHYKSKQEVFDTIIGEFCAYISLHNVEQEFQMIFSCSSDSFEEALYHICYTIFRFYAKDPLVCQVKNMLNVEQYKSKEKQHLYRQLFIEEPLKKQSEVFKRLMENGQMYAGNAYILAYEFYAVVFLLMQQNDDNEVKAQMMLRCHVREFRKCYML